MNTSQSLRDPAARGRLTGAVVRWALPDALTAGGAADPQTGAVAFPHVPNRWLVCRRVPGSAGDTASWILASDYLGGHGTSFYANGEPAVLGMCWPLASWPWTACLPEVDGAAALSSDTTSRRARPRPAAVGH